MTARRRSRSVAVAAVCALAATFAAGCGFPKAAPAPRLYVLGAPTADAAQGPRVTWWLAVDRPDADGGLDTAHIAVRPTAHRLAYYARAQWTDSAPDMMRRLVLAAFRDTHRITGVGDRPDGIEADYALELELREFYAVVPPGGGAPEVQVALTATLLHGPTGAIVGQRRFRVTQRAASKRIDSVVDAFERATSAAIARLVPWTLRVGQAAAERTSQPLSLLQSRTW